MLKLSIRIFYKNHFQISAQQRPYLFVLSEFCASAVLFISTLSFQTWFQSFPSDYSDRTGYLRKLLRTQKRMLQQHRGCNGADAPGNRLLLRKRSNKAAYWIYHWYNQPFSNWIKPKAKYLFRGSLSLAFYGKAQGSYNFLRANALHAILVQFLVFPIQGIIAGSY